MQLIAGCALTVLHLLDIQKTGGTDSVFSVILSEFYASPDAPIIQVLKIFTYLELVFSLSAMFSASLFLCLRIVSDGETPCNPVDGPSLDAKLDLSGSIRDHWFWMLRHCESIHITRMGRFHVSLA